MITLDTSDNSFNVPSQTTSGKKYNVRFDRRKQELQCECMHWVLKQTPCYHIRQVMIKLNSDYKKRKKEEIKA